MSARWPARRNAVQLRVGAAGADIVSPLPASRLLQCAGQDSEIFAFASGVDTDQRMEIASMGAMLEELTK